MNGGWFKKGHKFIQGGEKGWFKPGQITRRIPHKIINAIECRNCQHCHQWKPLNEFFKNKSKWDGLSLCCKICTYQDQKNRILNNPERQREIQRHWREKRRTEYNYKKSQYYHLRTRKYPEIRINAAIRSGIYESILGRKNGKKWQVLVGYNLKDLMNHLQAHFHPEMTWDNFGQWHIDHKNPICSFHFKSSDDLAFKECWSLKNLQPLWAKDNLIKSNKIIFHSLPISV